MPLFFFPLFFKALSTCQIISLRRALWCQERAHLSAANKNALKTFWNNNFGGRRQRLNACDQKPALCSHVKIKYLLGAHLRIMLRNRHKRHGIVLAFVPPLTEESAVTVVSRFSWCLTQSDCVGQTKTLRRLLRLRLHTEISSSLFISPLFVPEET